MKVTRKQILQAIRKEPLKAGQWIHGRIDGESLRIVTDKNCKVCAVGAVLRNAGVKNNRIEEMANDKVLNRGPCIPDDGTTANELSKGRYLNALSIKFEDLAKKYGTGKRTREKLATFVKENFPKTINIR